MDREEFDAVVVGSGFGGSVMTYRLAEAGLRVCLLERGQSYPPGAFPRSSYKMKKNFWDPSEGLYGIFNIWSFDNLGAVASSGLGGGSLIYANVLIRKPKEWFVEQDPTSGEAWDWPVKGDELEIHYERVEHMLGAQKYPFTRKPYSDTPKTKEFIAAAEKLGLRACFAGLRVGMVVYALAHEKDLHYRPLRRGVDLSEEPSSGLKATDQHACPRLAGGLRRHLLRLEEWLPLADVAR
jgi:choline dehydrogenase-like flavoprotein